jgi:hypothetical protein
MDDLWAAMNRGHAKAKAKAKATGQKMEDMLFSVDAKPGDETVQTVQEINASGRALPFVWAFI